MSYRVEKVNELIKHIVSQLLLKEVNFGEGMLVTVTNVDTSPDLSHSKAKFIVLPLKKNEEALEIINKNIYHLQQELNKKMKMKTVPKIIFEIDQAEIKAQRIEEILEKSKESKN